MYDTYNNTYTYTFIILTSTYRCPYYLTLLIDALPNTSKLGGSMPACERAARLSLLPVSVNRPYICIYIYTMYVYVYIYIYIYICTYTTNTNNNNNNNNNVCEKTRPFYVCRGISAPRAERARGDLAISPSHRRGTLKGVPTVKSPKQHF